MHVEAMCIDHTNEMLSERFHTRVKCNTYKLASLKRIERKSLVKGELLYEQKNTKHEPCLPSYIVHVRSCVWQKGLPKFSTKYPLFSILNIGIKHVFFSCINIRQVPWDVLKTEAEGRGFKHLPRDLANVNALKNHVWSLLLHKNWKHLLQFGIILALFYFAFSPMSLERIFHGLCSFYSTQYTSRNGNKSVAPVRPYWKLRSRALTARELPC